MKNKYVITEKNLKKFTKEPGSTWLVQMYTSLHNGKTIYTVTGYKDSVYDPKQDWKLVPNGDGTFSAYRI